MISVSSSVATHDSNNRTAPQCVVVGVSHAVCLATSAFDGRSGATDSTAWIAIDENWSWEARGLAASRLKISRAKSVSANAAHYSARTLILLGAQSLSCGQVNGSMNL